MTPTSFENLKAPGFETLSLIQLTLCSEITIAAIFSAKVSTNSNLLFSTKAIIALLIDF